MKKRNWIYWMLMITCLVIFVGYRVVQDLRADTKAPTINIAKQELSLSVQDAESALLLGVTAQDDKDGDVSDSLMVESIKLLRSDGTARVTYAAFDQAGNVAKVTREVRYTDYQSPRFSLSTALIFSENASINLFNYITATDLLEGDISHRVRITSLDNVSNSQAGGHTVELRVTNSFGETAKLVIPVELYSSNPHRAKLTLTDYLVYLPVGSDFNAESYLKEYALNSSIVSLEDGIPQSFSLETTGEVDPQTPGTYVVSYVVTYTVVNPSDPDLSQTYTGYSKLIVVIEG